MLRFSALLVFDNNPKHALSYPHRSQRSTLEIVYAPSHLSADDYILEYLERFYEVKKKPTLITSDNELSRKAHLFGVKTLPISDFFALLHSKHEKRRRMDEKPTGELSRQIERYLSIFTKDL